VQRQAGLGQRVHRVPDLLRRVDRLADGLAVGQFQAVLRVEQVHLRAHDVDPAAARAQIVDLARIGLVIQIVVNVELHVFREERPDSLERLPGVVARHQPVMALADRIARHHQAPAEIGRALVDHVPTVDAALVALRQFRGALFEQALHLARVDRNQLGDLSGGQLGQSLFAEL